MHVAWKERYHGTLPSSKVNEYLRNFSAYMGAKSQSNAYPNRRSLPRGAKPSRGDGDMDQAQRDNQGEDDSGHTANFARPLIPIDSTH
eukprot:1251112-Karenia_brevis.AAC.1